MRQPGYYQSAARMREGTRPFYVQSFAFNFSDTNTQLGAFGANCVLDGKHDSCDFFWPEVPLPYFRSRECTN
jgi:hypothetical protein